MQQFRLPSLGADMDDGTLVAWKIKPGDTVRRGDVVAVIDTSKAAIDVESWQEGTVQELLVKPGDKFAVGTVMATLSGIDTRAQPGAGTSPRPAATAVEPEPEAVAPVPAPQRGLRITPAARKRAGELGLDPASLHGSGPDGSVTLRDVETAAAGAAAAGHDRSADMRRTIAAAMSRSKREIPHYYLGETIVLGKALDWLKQWNAARPVTARMLPGALLLKAVARALRKFPRLNGFHRDGGFEAAPAIHIGVAIALRSGGLIAPALLDAGTKPLETLMQDLNDLVQRTRAGSLRSSELNSATITVTNLGEQSVEEVFGVIYPPQVALIGFGGIREQVLAVDGSIRIMPTLRASLSADHRVSDGQLGARFLQHLAALLQDPAALAREDQA